MRTLVKTNVRIGNTEKVRYEWEDKAGGYAIQGKAARFITGIEGDYYSVVGLPVSRLYQMLKENGVIQKRCPYQDTSFLCEFPMYSKVVVIDLDKINQAFDHSTDIVKVSVI